MVIRPSLDPRPLRRWQLAHAASAPRSVAPDSRVACTGTASDSRPRRYRVSPTGDRVGAAASAPAHSSPESAIRAARAAARAPFSTAFLWGRVILGGSKQLLVVVHQLVR